MRMNWTQENLDVGISCKWIKLLKLMTLIFRGPINYQPLSYKLWLISHDSFYFKLCMALVRIGLASLEMDSVSHARVSADRDDKKTKLPVVFESVRYVLCQKLCMTHYWWVIVPMCLNTCHFCCRLFLNLMFGIFCVCLSLVKTMHIILSNGRLA